MKKELTATDVEVQKNLEQAVFTLLSNIPGEDAKREGLGETPKRVAKAYKEFFAGYLQDPKDILSKTFKTDNSQMVIVKDIPYYSHCEHHMVPFKGKVSIGYIPNGRVVGLSKLARLVDIYARRLQIQEQMTFQIAEAMQKYLKPKGVGVVVTGEHMCMTMRGVKKEGSLTITSDVRGAFKKNQITKSEFLKLIE